LLITPQHQELQEKYQKLVLRSMQFDMILQQKDDQVSRLTSEITPLKNVFEQLTGRVKELESRYESALKLIEEKDKLLQKLELIEHQYDQLKKLLYGRRSEKSSAVALPGQLTLGIDATLVEACKTDQGQTVAAYTKHKPTNTGHPGRNEIPKHICRNYIDLHPEGLPEGAERYDVIETEQLEYDPAKSFATVYRRYKCKRVKTDGVVEFFIAPLPDEKDKSLAAPSLKAHVTVDKYLYHMPIYRQLQKFSQLGIIISDTTMGDWINGACHSLTAIYDALRKDVVYSASKYLMADETSITVLDTEKIKGRKAHTGFMWSYCNPVDRLVFFEYQRGRANKHARPVLENFRGTLHTDGYGVYKHHGNREGVIHVNCNAHARRKFDEAKFTDRARAEHVLTQYARLYAIEKYCSENNLSFDERKEIRQQKSAPVFEELAAWIKAQLTKVTTLRSPIGKALAYFSEREKQQGVYLTDGMLLMDTNLIENTIRPIALGRNNYLFAGSHDAAQNAAIIYSLLATCKLHEVNAYDWLKYVLTIMPTFPSSRIRELLPHNWKAAITNP